MAGVLGSTTSSSNGYVERLQANGQVDLSYGQQGRVVIDNGPTDAGPSLAVLPSGKAVIGETVQDYADDTASVVVTRLNNDGSFDTSFSGDGTATLAPVGSVQFDFGGRVAVQADGKIVVAGTSTQKKEFGDVFVKRLNTDGSLDTSFATGGTQVVPYTGQHQDEMSDLVAQADGKIVVSGDADQQSAIGVARLTGDGGFDTTFSSDGITTVPFATSGDAGGSAVDADGHVLLSGSQSSTGGYRGQALLARITGSGELDPTFGTNGVRLDNFSDDTGTASNATDVTVQVDGRIITAGTVRSSGPTPSYRSYVARYSSAGTTTTATTTSTATTTPGLTTPEPVSSSPPPVAASPAGGRTPIVATPKPGVSPPSASAIPRLLITALTSSAGVVGLPLECKGANRCAGTATLTTTVAAARAARASKKQIRLGAARYAIASGRSVKLRVKLTATGRRLLRSKRKLRVTVTLKPSGGGAVAARHRFLTVKAL